MCPIERTGILRTGPGKESQGYIHVLTVAVSRCCLVSHIIDETKSLQTAGKLEFVQRDAEDCPNL